MKDPRFPDDVEFFPCHPSDEKTKQIQTSPSPVLAQTGPFQVKELRDEFEADLDAGLANCLPKYQDKRFMVTGVAISVAPDMHGLPTVQLSDTADGPCYAHCIFPAEGGLPDVEVGDRVIILSNYLVYCHPLGVVMKFSEMVENFKKQIVFDRIPTNEEIRAVEFAPCEKIEQSAPFAAKALYDSFYEDQTLLEKYTEKRMQVTGIVTKAGLDMHNLPSLELSDSVDGRTYALCISHEQSFIEGVQVGDTVTVEGNYLSMSTRLGVIFKYSERVEA